MLYPVELRDRLLGVALSDNRHPARIEAKQAFPDHAPAGATCRGAFIALSI